MFVCVMMRMSFHWRMSGFYVLLHPTMQGAQPQEERLDDATNTILTNRAARCFCFLTSKRSVQARVFLARLCQTTEIPSPTFAQPLERCLFSPAEVRLLGIRN